jgi:hypothetical protein
VKLNEKHAIAQRVRRLLGEQLGELATVARRLRVNESDLQATVDQSAPQPSVDVLAAVVVAYGVEPMWLLFGDYDPSMHRHVGDEVLAGRPSGAVRNVLSAHWNDGRRSQATRQPIGA